jgi:hypothetical protein
MFGFSGKNRKFFAAGTNYYMLFVLLFIIFQLFINNCYLLIIICVLSNYMCPVLYVLGVMGHVGGWVGLCVKVYVYLEP